MARTELIMPKMGESIMEATILKWVKNVGDRVEMDEPILEIATDKVDSEVPSPVDGVIAEIKFPVDAVVPIGTVIAVIETKTEAPVTDSPAVAPPAHASAPQFVAPPATPVAAPASVATGGDDRFYSPLVRSMAKENTVSPAELATIPGTGLNGRVTKKDLVAYLSRRTQPAVAETPLAAAPPAPAPAAVQQPAAQSLNGQYEIIEMDRMRKLIAEHMVMSKHTSPHVTSFVEADVTDIVNWRNKHKETFKQQYGENITFTPIFIDAIVRAIRDFPLINVSVDGTRIIVKKDINIGMATALPTGNLIVPVIKNADRYNLVGLTQQVNDLANRARQNKLKPDEIQDGTFTVTNVGSFGNVMGTPIINQPQVAIMAVGAIRKRPAVLETPAGDVIAIRHMMFLSMSYDHRVVDGMLGGSFIRRVADYLEQFDTQRTI